MFGVFKIIAILALICVVPLSNAKRKFKAKYGPTGMGIKESTSCKEFAQYARFNPYSVLGQTWFVFYYWGPPTSIETYKFIFPTANHTKYLHKLLDGNTILPINWDARRILMESRKEEVTLLVERGDRGQYWGFLLQKVRKGQRIRPRDLRFKQTGDGKMIGFMDCDRETAFAMCKIEEVPPKNRLQDEAARLNYRARRGKSYLYEGHEWMPIPEADEKHYWAPKKKEKSSEKSSEQSSNEVGSTSKEEVDLKKTDQPLNDPKDQVVEDQSSEEQVDDKDSNNKTNVGAKEENENKETSKELVEENNDLSIIDSTYEPHKLLTIEKKNDINNKPEKKEENNKLKPSQTVIEPEVVTEEEMELLTTQSSRIEMNKKSDGDKKPCRTCFTLLPRRRESKKAEAKTPDPQISLNNPTDSEAMETEHENKGTNKEDKENDGDIKKDLNTDKNEV